MEGEAFDGEGDLEETGCWLARVTTRDPAVDPALLEAAGRILTALKQCGARGLPLDELVRVVATDETLSADRLEWRIFTGAVLDLLEDHEPPLIAQNGQRVVAIIK